MEHQGTAVLDKGTRLGKYALERLIGVGSMGAVYQGVRTETGERFAIKVLSPGLAAMPPARARFLAEAKLTARVHHPHIVNVTDVGEDAGRCYLVMEMLEGEDLSRRLERAGPLAVAETADIMRPVCDAVAEAHRRGITHRDLKPSNIFLASREGRPYPIVLDFGIAKDHEGAGVGDAAGAVPGGKAVFGTPYYLAPEQVADHQAAGPASDQHALGVILYECLTGRPPYGGDSVEEVFRAIVAGSPAPPSTRRPDVPQAMNAVVLRALKSDPKRRFVSVAELGLALHPFASKSAGTTPASYRRPPSSPAIDAEGATPSPFRRTLTPEVEALNGPWFAAPEPEETSGELPIPSPIEADAAPDAEPLLSTEPSDELDAPASGRWKLASRRMRIGAAAGVALSGLVLALVMTGGRSSAPRPQMIPTPTAEALVQIEPAPAKPAMEAVPVIPVAEAPPAAAIPVPAEAPPPAPIPSEAPPSTPPPPAVNKELTTAVPASPPREPSPSEPSEVHAAVEVPRARKSVDKPRASRAGAGIRMHNGVPLLD